MAKPSQSGLVHVKMAPANAKFVKAREFDGGKIVDTDDEMIMMISIQKRLPADPKTGMGQWCEVRGTRVNLTGNPVVDDRAIQSVAFEAKMEYARQAVKERRARKGRGKS